MHGDARGRHGQRGAAAQAGRGPEHRTNAGTVASRWINSAVGREVNASGRLTRSSLRRGHRGQGLTEGTGQDGPSKPGSTTMPRNYQVERDAIFRRWYGNNPQPLNPRPNRSPGASVIGPEDCLGIPIPVNLPFMPWGHCMVWKYTLNQGGYGVQRDRHGLRHAAGMASGTQGNQAERGLGRQAC